MKIRGQTVYAPEDRIRRMVAVDDQTGCWLWTGTVRSREKPYGRLVVGSRSDGTRRATTAHRYSYEVFKGAIPPGDWCVCHTCDNPRCVNPDHLWLGTKRDNARDMQAKGRTRWGETRYGEDSPRAILTNQQVAEIRASDMSSDKIAPLYGVSGRYVRDIRMGRARNYLPNPPEAA